MFFEKFLGKNGFRSKIFSAQNDRNVHLNSVGLGKLSKLYLTIIHSNYFNPLFNNLGVIYSLHLFL